MSEIDLSKERFQYMWGDCHVFAIAMVRKYGGRFLVFEHAQEMHYCGEHGEEDIPIVLHVLALIDDENGNTFAWDVNGPKDLDDVVEDVADNYSHGVQMVLNQEIIDTEEMLVDCYIDTEDTGVYPLEQFSEDDVKKALGVVEAVVAAEGIPATSFDM